MRLQSEERLDADRKSNVASEVGDVQVRGEPLVIDVLSDKTLADQRRFGGDVKPGRIFGAEAQDFSADGAVVEELDLGGQFRPGGHGPPLDDDGARRCLRRRIPGGHKAVPGLQQGNMPCWP